MNMMTHDEVEDAIERLRKLSHGARVYNALEVMEAVIPDGSWVDGLIDLLRQADPDTHMELPVDADGEYIHIGDELCGYGYQSGGAYCMAINGKDAIFVSELGSMSYKDMLLWDPKDCRHYHKPTVSSILDELEGLRGTGDYEAVVTRAAELAEQLRELLEVMTDDDA